jgi:hypothetical protein
MYSFPTNVVTPDNDVATAAVEPEIKPGHPPKIEVMELIIIVLCNPADGGRPRIKENAIDSGISNIAIVNPEIISLICSVAVILEISIYSLFTIKNIL